MSRWPLLVRIAAGTVLILLVIHTAGWWWLSRQVRDGYAAWAEAMRAAGHAVTAAASPELTGWPLEAGIALPGATVDGPGWRWTADRLSLTVRPWDLAHLRLQPTGHETLAVNGVQLGLDARSLLVTLALPAGTDPALDADGAILETPWGRTAAARVSGNVVTDASRTQLTVDLSGLSLPPGQPYLLGPAVAAVHLAAAVTPPAPSPRRPDLLAWRDAGGKVEITEARLRWGRLAVDATGTAALDRALQPVADLRATLSGQDAALDDAAAHGLVPPRTALAIRAVLSLLGGASPGQPARIPASLRDGVVAVAGFPVARLPPIPLP